MIKFLKHPMKHIPLTLYKWKTEKRKIYNQKESNKKIVHDTDGTILYEFEDEKYGTIIIKY